MYLLLIYYTHYHSLLIKCISSAGTHSSDWKNQYLFSNLLMIHFIDLRTLISDTRMYCSTPWHDAITRRLHSWLAYTTPPRQPGLSDRLHLPPSWEQVVSSTPASFSTPNLVELALIILVLFTYPCFYLLLYDYLRYCNHRHRLSNFYGPRYIIGHDLFVKPKNFLKKKMQAFIKQTSNKNKSSVISTRQLLPNPIHQLINVWLCYR